MPFDVDLKVGDNVCSFYDWRGKVKHLNYSQGELSSVTVKWQHGRLMTHPCTAEDIWLEGQPSKELPEVKERRQYLEQQDALDAKHVTALEAFKIEIKSYTSEQLNIVWAPEPLDEAATLEGLTQEIVWWAEVVQFLDGDQDDDDIKHDLYCRECLHGTLNGLKKQGVAIPAELLDKLAKADQFFIEHSLALEPPNVVKLKSRVLGMVPITLLDPVAFWYVYRWPKIREP